MNIKNIIALLLLAPLLLACGDEGSQGSSKDEISEVPMPYLSHLGINKCVKSYGIYTDSYTFRMRTDDNGNRSFQNMSFKDIYEDSFGSMNITFNPFQIRITFRTDINIMNDYFRNFVFKYDGGPVVEMENVSTRADGSYNSQSKIALTYDANDYLQNITETVSFTDSTVIYKTVMNWENAESTSGKRLKAMLKYRNGTLFDQITFNYSNRTRVNKEGITSFMLAPYISGMDFYEINAALALYGFWGRPSSELPTSFHWGVGSIYETLNVIHYDEDDDGNLIRIKNGNYDNLEETFTYY